MKNKDIARLLIALDTCKTKKLNVYSKIIKMKKAIKEQYDINMEALRSIEGFESFMENLSAIASNGKIENAISVWFDCIIGFGFDAEKIKNESDILFKENAKIIKQVEDFAECESKIDFEKLTFEESKEIELIEQNTFSESLYLIIE